MESTFFQWIESIIPGSGLILAILIVGGGLIIGFLKFLKKISNDYKTSIVEQTRKTAEFDDMKSTINDISTKMDSMINTDQERSKSIAELHRRIDDVCESISKQEEASIDGDVTLQKQVQSYENHFLEMSKKMDEFGDSINLLIDSDKESIKSFIATQYYLALERQYIEVYVLETIEERYKKYLLENGNTFVASLMKELRALPHKPPKKTEEK